jgi:hypothetical protein
VEQLGTCHKCAEPIAIIAPCFVKHVLVSSQIALKLREVLGGTLNEQDNITALRGI